MSGRHMVGIGTRIYLQMVAPDFPPHPVLPVLMGVQCNMPVSNIEKTSHVPAMRRRLEHGGEYLIATNAMHPRAQSLIKWVSQT
jgi:hypothetical protein